MSLQEEYIIYNEKCHFMIFYVVSTLSYTETISENVDVMMNLSVVFANHYE